MHEVSLHPRCNQSTKTHIISWDLEHRNPPVNLSWPHLFVETRRFDLMHSWQLLVFGVYLLSLLERPNTPDAHGGASKIKILTPQKRYKSFLLCCSVCNWLCSPRVCVLRGEGRPFLKFIGIFSIQCLDSFFRQPHLKIHSLASEWWKCRLVPGAPEFPCVKLILHNKQPSCNKWSLMLAHLIKEKPLKEAYSEEIVSSGSKDFK